MKKIATRFVTYIAVIGGTFYIVPLIFKFYMLYVLESIDQSYGFILPFVAIFHSIVVLGVTFTLYFSMAWLFRRELSLKHELVAFFVIYVLVLVLFTNPWIKF